LRKADLVIALYPAFIAGWLLTLALLAIEHLLWKDAPRVVRYCLGAGTICIGCSVAGSILDDPVLAFGPWFITSAGLLIVAWTWYDDRTQTTVKTAHKSGEVVGATRGLTQELIDRGSERHRPQN
jgi:membrane protein implicated in regulation of membrane protease activity